MGARVEVVDKITKYRIYTDTLCTHLKKSEIITNLENCAGQLAVEQLKKVGEHWMIIISVTGNGHERTFTCVSDKLKDLGLISAPLIFPK